MTDTSLQPVEAGAPLTAPQLKTRLVLIQNVMRDVMDNGIDYGVIPGTQKPTLFKPGAEKLCVTFRLAAADPTIVEIPDAAGNVRYRVRVPVKTADGSVVAVGVGECSTGEEKYHWRRPVHPHEYDRAPEDRRREKFTRSGEVWQQVRVEPADVANTVLKMAHKRAYVHAVLMATAASAIFTQDLDDDDLDAVGDQAPPASPARPPITPPQRKPVEGSPQRADLLISEPQAKRFYALAINAGWTADEVKAWLNREYHVEHIADIPRKRYDEIVAAMQKDREP